MLLHALLKQVQPDVSLDGVPNIEITGVCEDSRLVGRGNLFVARGGMKTDGRQFIADAAGRGAAAVVSEKPIEGCAVPQINLVDAAAAVGKLAQAFYEHPSKRVRVLGVTGTNGKTTTAYLIRHILASVKSRCGMIGTVEIDDGRTCREAAMTTPSACELAGLLAHMRDRGCRCCAMEVSSHALDQQRVGGIRFAGAAFTNLSGDHLDYHKTMDAYAAAKARLFEMLEPDAVAVVNAADKASVRIARDCRARLIQFAIGRKGDWRARKVRSNAQGSHFVLEAHGDTAQVNTPLIGRHNIANALTAAALVGEVFDLSVGQIAAALSTASGAPGRLEPVRCGQNFGVFIDYAHTDDGLENVLTALRPLTRGKLRVLFGCGGDRDRTKRPRMAKVAEKLADAIYITSDNPRTEDPAAIIDEIVSGLCADVRRSGAASASGRCAIVEPDRRRAIERVLADAAEGDVVLIAGKGHEKYQIVGTEKRHFDDVEEARRVLEGRNTAAA